jgi:hypothetical protein
MLATTIFGAPFQTVHATHRTPTTRKKSGGCMGRKLLAVIAACLALAAATTEAGAQTTTGGVTGVVRTIGNIGLKALD